jgi:hypothetical protein
MAVEYGSFLILLILIFVVFLIMRNFNKSNKLEIALVLMFLVQNTTNDLVYAPDVAIYFWIVPFYFLSSVFKD